MSDSVVVGVGSKFGESEGSAVASRPADGFIVVVSDSFAEGDILGASVGRFVGSIVGGGVGKTVSAVVSDSFAEGDILRASVGRFVGTTVGRRVGLSVGAVVGSIVGDGAGRKLDKSTRSPKTSWSDSPLALLAPSVVG